MKKALKAAIAIILIIAILSVPALAGASTDAQNGGLKYVSLGDSIAVGTGLPDNPLRGPEQPDKTKVFCYKAKGAYPTLIAEALGVSDENYSQLACAGMRTVELRACIDPDYTAPDSYANNFQNNELQTWVRDRFDFRALIEDADVITLNMCANDIASFALFYTQAEIEKAISVDMSELSDIEQLGNGGEHLAELLELIEKSGDPGIYKLAVETAIKGLNIGFTRWTENWDAIIGTIYELNPDVKLACLGVYNPLDSIKLTKCSLLEIGEALDGFVDSVNYWARTGSAYADRYIYVDIMDIETMYAAKGSTLTDDGFFKSFELDVHPSEKGHRQIADKVLEALEEQQSQIFFCLTAQIRQLVRLTVNRIGFMVNRMMSIILR